MRWRDGVCKLGFINRADAALYEAKAAGRNTVKLQSETNHDIQG